MLFTQAGNKDPELLVGLLLIGLNWRILCHVHCVWFTQPNLSGMRAHGQHLQRICLIIHCCIAVAVEF